ncbi:MAG: ATP synthase F1 subunit delta [Oscillospiraceae bacterium]
MAELVCKTYALSLFDVSLADKNENEILSQLKTVAQIASDNPTFLQIMDSPIVEKKDKKEILSNVLEGKISPYLYNFLRILIDNSRFFLLEDICEEFQSLYNKHNNIICVTVVTATELTQELYDKLLIKLKNVTNKEIKLNTVVDKEIIGGVLLRYQDHEIDSTVKKQLQQLKLTLKNIIA